MSEYSDTEGMCVSESADREADMERCCTAQRPASVSRVVTTVETPHNTERQRQEKGGGGGSGRQKKKKKKGRELRKIQ